MMPSGMTRGVLLDAVGELVLEALPEIRLYIHNHRIITGAIEARTRVLLDAMPAKDGAKVSRAMRSVRPIPPTDLRIVRCLLYRQRECASRNWPWGRMMRYWRRGGREPHRAGASEHAPSR
jgi:hypothetical protein